jgi:hypothetical protein
MAVYRWARRLDLTSDSATGRRWEIWPELEPPVKQIFLRTNEVYGRPRFCQREIEMSEECERISYRIVFATDDEEFFARARLIV